MASRILGLMLGLIFISLGLLPFIAVFTNGFFEIELVQSIMQTIYYTLMAGPIPIISVIFILIGLFCLQSSVRDTWPFYV